jgi:flagellin-like protein
MHFKTLKNKKAVSPIIATLLLILIAVAAGVIIYVWATSYIGQQIGSVGGQETFVITNVKYNKISGTNYVNVTVINQGISAINITTIKVYASDYSTLVATNTTTTTYHGALIAPGATSTFNIRLKLVTGQQIIKGQSYVLEVTTVKGNTAVYRFTA